MRNEKCWIEIHQICGDCGRRYVHKVEITDEEPSKNEMRFIKEHMVKYNMACLKCSNK